MSNDPEKSHSDNTPEDAEIISPIEGLKRAESVLMYFASVLEDVEGNDDSLVNLDELSSTHIIKGGLKETFENGIWVVRNEADKPLTKRQALELTLEQLKKYMDYLPQNEQDEAHKLIIRARLYIVDNTFTQEQKAKAQKQ